MRCILHPTDFSVAARPAFRAALQLAKEYRAHLLLLHVLPPLPLTPDVYAAATRLDQLRRAQRLGGRRQLDRLIARAKAARVRVSGLVADFGVPAQRIVGTAKRKRADVIVMGTHGRTGIARAVLGSVAERVLATAGCPVLTVRAR